MRISSCAPRPFVSSFLCKSEMYEYRSFSSKHKLYLQFTQPFFVSFFLQTDFQEEQCVLNKCWSVSYIFWSSGWKERIRKVVVHTVNEVSESWYWIGHVLIHRMNRWRSKYWFTKNGSVNLNERKKISTASNQSGVEFIVKTGLMDRIDICTR